MVPLNDMRIEYERITIEIVNTIGVDLNMLLKYPHLQN